MSVPRDLDGDDELVSGLVILLDRIAAELVAVRAAAELRRLVDEIRRLADRIDDSLDVALPARALLDELLAEASDLDVP